MTFIIVEEEDVGGREAVVRQLVATESVYGGNPFPCFPSRSAAKRFIFSWDEKWRKFKVVELKEGA